MLMGLALAAIEIGAGCSGVDQRRRNRAVEQSCPRRHRIVVTGDFCWPGGRVIPHHSVSLLMLDVVSQVIELTRNEETDMQLKNPF